MLAGVSQAPRSTFAVLRISACLPKVGSHRIAAALLGLGRAAVGGTSARQGGQRPDGRQVWRAQFAAPLLGPAAWMGFHHPCGFGSPLSLRLVGFPTISSIFTLAWKGHLMPKRRER